MPADNVMPNRLPIPGAGFAWDGVFLRPDCSEVAAVFTTRLGGSSPAPLDTLNLSSTAAEDLGIPETGEQRDDNWSRVLSAIGAEAVGRVNQVHGSDCVGVDPERRPRADAVTAGPDEPAAAVISADCLPILAVGTGRLAVIHAGWRGLAAGVIESALSTLDAQVRVWVGPGIGPCCYEVGDDVASVFTTTISPDVVEGRSLDLFRSAEILARRAGASEVYVSGLCTSCNPGLFYSHRRDHGITGRQGLAARWI